MKPIKSIIIEYRFITIERQNNMLRAVGLQTHGISGGFSDTFLNYSAKKMDAGPPTKLEVNTCFTQIQ